MNATVPGPGRARVFVFIDASELVAGPGGSYAAEEVLDWEGFPRRLAVDATSVALLQPAERLSYVGSLIYVRDDPASRTGGGSASKIIDELSKDPLARLRTVPAKMAALGECRACDLAGTSRCHRCRNMNAPTSVLGGAVGHAIATDLFRLLREDAVDIAVLLSADPGLVYAVRAVERRGKRVVHAAFPPRGRELSAASSGMVDLSPPAR